MCCLTLPSGRCAIPESGVKLLNGDRVLQSGAPLKGGRERFSMADYSVLGDPLA